MKCDRCHKDKGNINAVETDIKIYMVCDDCFALLDEFINGKELCNSNKAYATVMYEEDEYE